MAAPGLLICGLRRRGAPREVVCLNWNSSRLARPNRRRRRCSPAARPPGRWAAARTFWFNCARGRLPAGMIVDLKRIPGALGIRQEGGGFVIGASTPGIAIGDHAALRQAWPGVVEAANLIGSTQIQGRASMAGNLCNASPAADSVPALIAARRDLPDRRPGGPSRPRRWRRSPSPRAARPWPRANSCSRSICRRGPPARPTPICARSRAPRWTSRGGRGDQPDPGRGGRDRPMRAVALGAVAPTVLLVAECGRGPGRRASWTTRPGAPRRGCARRLQSDQRQAGHGGIPNQDRRGAGQAGGVDRLRRSGQKSA